MDKSRLLADIRSERAKLELLLGRIDARAMADSAVGEWSVKDILAHISMWEITFLRWLETAARGERPAMPAPGMSWSDIDRLNDQTFQANRARPLAEVRAEFASSYATTLSAIEALDEGVLVDPDLNPLGAGEPLWGYAAANTSDHYREHREPIEAWIASKA